VICALAIACCVATAPPTTAPDEPKPVIEKVELAGETFKLEVAADDPARAKGLQGRKELAPHGGMLFIHPRPRVLSYWMVDCVIDIDVLFINAQGRVVAVHEMKADPQHSSESRPAYEYRLRRYRSRRPAQFAIEVPTGTIERLKLEVGDEIDLDLPRLKEMAR
jgi:hypothetical protein